MNDIVLGSSTCLIVLGFNLYICVICEELSYVIIYDVCQSLYYWEVIEFSHLINEAFRFSEEDEVLSCVVSAFIGFEGC